MKKLLYLLLLISSYAIGQTQLELPYSIKVLNPKPLDGYYYNTSFTPYTNTAQVISQVASSVRYRGQVFNVAGVEYWFKAGTSDGDLIVKATDNIYTADGTLTGNRSVTNGDFNLDFHNNRTKFTIRGDGNFDFSEPAFGLNYFNTGGNDLNMIFGQLDSISGGSNFSNVIIGERSSITDTPIGSYDNLVVGIDVRVRGSQYRIISGQNIWSVGGGRYGMVSGYHVVDSASQASFVSGYGGTQPLIIGNVVGSSQMSSNDVGQTAGDGLHANYSAIIGGVNHNIPKNSPNSVILGGHEIKARLADPNEVYVPQLNIATVPTSDSTLTQFIVRDASTGKLKYRNFSTIVPNSLPIKLWSTPQSGYKTVISATVSNIGNSPVIAFRDNSARTFTDGILDVYIGSGNGNQSALAGNNIGIGNQNLKNITVGTSFVNSGGFIGYFKGDRNIAIGYSNGVALNPSGSNQASQNIMIGQQNLQSSTGAAFNYIMGYRNALSYTGTSMQSNVLIGEYLLGNATTIGIANALIGSHPSSGGTITSVGNFNNSVGQSFFGVTTLGNNNSTIGNGFYSNTGTRVIQNYNSSIGEFTFFNANQTNLLNTSIASGMYAGAFSGGNRNSFFGVNSGYNVIGNENTYVGYASGYTTDKTYQTTGGLPFTLTAGTQYTGSRSTFIGYKSGYSTTTPSISDVLVIGNTYTPSLVANTAYLGGFSNGYQFDSKVLFKSISNKDTATHVLVADFSTGEIKYRRASTIGSVGTSWLLSSGGTLTGPNTIIGSTTNNLLLSSVPFNITLPNASSQKFTAQLQSFSRGHFELGIGSSASQSYISIKSGTGGTSGQITLDNSNILGTGAGLWVSDGANIGLQYLIDYSSNFTSLSLISRKYADEHLKGLTFTNTPTSGDVPTFNGTNWTFSTPSGGVSSVFGRTGAVTAQSGDYTTAQVTENTNLYYTDARARASNSFTSGSGAYNSSTGVITIPTNTNELTNGAGCVTASSSTTFTNKSGNISQWTNDSGYITASSSNTLTNKSGNISQWTNDANYTTGQTWIDHNQSTSNLTTTISQDGINTIVFSPTTGVISINTTSGTWDIWSSFDFDVPVDQQDQTGTITASGVGWDFATIILMSQSTHVYYKIEVSGSDNLGSGSNSREKFMKVYKL